MTRQGQVINKHGPLHPTPRACPHYTQNVCNPNIQLSSVIIATTSSHTYMRGRLNWGNIGGDKPSVAGLSSYSCTNCWCTLYSVFWCVVVAVSCKRFYLWNLSESWRRDFSVWSESGCSLRWYVHVCSVAYFHCFMLVTICRQLGGGILPPRHISSSRPHSNKIPMAIPMFLGSNFF